jgi:predicted transcriptional regulator
VNNEAVQQPEDELNTTTFDLYLYLVKTGQPTGPRDIMRALDITSPGVVHRHLQKLSDWGWVDKDSYGRYAVKKKVGFKGYVWLGKKLFPMSILFAFVFVGLSIIWVAVLALHLWIGSPIDQSYSILTAVTIIATVFFLVNALRPGKRTPKQPVGV